MMVRFLQRCLQGTCVIALPLTLHAQDKPRFSAELAVHSDPAAERDLGITKMYNIVLVNNSSDTLFVNQCEFTEDTPVKFTVTPYALQRWNQHKKSWDTVLAHTPDYCGGYQTRARAIRTAVAPGQRLVVDGDFVGANAAFSYGDRARFLVFLDAPGEYDDVVESPEFRLDERRSKPPRTPPNATHCKGVEPKSVTLRRSKTSRDYLVNVSFLTPGNSNQNFNYVSVYGGREVNGQRSNDKEYLFLRGDWKPNERVEFSVQVPRESTDHAKGWFLHFCVGSVTPSSQPGTLNMECYPSENLLCKVAHDHKAQAQ